MEDVLRDEALSKFFDSSEIKCTPTTGGVNNVVQYVETTDGKRYILRIYNNGNKSEKVGRGTERSAERGGTDGVRPT